jgi:hypothetical protein
MITRTNDTSITYARVIAPIWQTQEQVEAEAANNLESAEIETHTISEGDVYKNNSNYYIPYGTTCKVVSFGMSNLSHITYKFVLSKFLGKAEYTVWVSARELVTLFSKVGSATPLINGDIDI